MPKLEPVANLKPITISRIDTDEPMALLPIKEPESMSTQQWKTRGNESRRSEANNKGCVVSKKEPVPLLVELPTKNITSIQTDMPWVDNDEPDFEFIAYRMNANLAFAQLDDIDFAEDVEEERSLSYIGKGIYRLTNGRHDSFASLFSSGFNTAKQEIRLAATDVALTAYHRADERIEGAKERWQEKHEE